MTRPSRPLSATVDSSRRGRAHVDSKFGEKAGSVAEPGRGGVRGHLAEAPLPSSEDSGFEEPYLGEWGVDSSGETQMGGLIEECGAPMSFAQYSASLRRVEQLERMTKTLQEEGKKLKTDNARLRVGLSGSALRLGELEKEANTLRERHSEIWQELAHLSGSTFSRKIMAPTTEAGESETSAPVAPWRPLSARSALASVPERSVAFVRVSVSARPQSARPNSDPSHSTSSAVDSSTAAKLVDYSAKPILTKPKQRRE